MLEELLQAAADAPQAELVTEAEYHSAWCGSIAKEQNCFAMALTGGLLANRFAFIFSAGYQAAVRHVFPTATFNGWSAFAVSEDRAEENPLPGLSYVETADGLLLSGYKTWIAASDYCDRLIVSARGEKGTLYFDIEVARPEVQLVTKPVGRMLPDLSQGKAQFEQYLCHTPLDADGVRGFAPAEVFYIYTAFLASTWASYPQRREVVMELLAAAEILSRRATHAWDEGQMALDAGVQALLAEMRLHEGEQHDRWRRDYKLVAMYSRQPRDSD